MRKNARKLVVGMHRISGWPDNPVTEKAGYPAKYATQELYIITAYNILRSFDFM